MRRRDYDTLYDETTGNTETQIAADEPIWKKYGNVRNAYEEGFASSHGVRNETVETGGRARHPETQDHSKPDRVPDSIEKENPGLAESQVRLVHAQRKLIIINTS